MTPQISLLVFVALTTVVVVVDGQQNITSDNPITSKTSAATTTPSNSASIDLQQPRCSPNYACFTMIKKAAFVKLHVVHVDVNDVRFELTTLYELPEDQYIGLSLRPDDKSEALLVTCTPDGFKSYTWQEKSGTFQPITTGSYAFISSGYEDSKHHCNFVYNSYAASEDDTGAWKDLEKPQFVSIVRGQFESGSPVNIISKIRSMSEVTLVRDDHTDDLAEVGKPIFLAYISVMIFVWIGIFIGSNICNFLSNYGLNSSLRKAHGALSAVIVVSSLTICIGFFIAHVMQDVTSGRYKVPHYVLASITLVLVLVLIVFVALMHTGRFRNDVVFPRYFSVMLIITQIFAVATILVACADAAEYVQSLVFYLIMLVCIIEVFMELLYDFVHADRKMTVISVIYGVVTAILTLSAIVLLWVDK